MYGLKKASSLSPEDIASKLSMQKDFVWLDSAMLHPQLGRYSYICMNAVETLSTEMSLDELESILSSYESTRLVNGPPFQGGLVGFFDYEFSDQRSITQPYFATGHGSAHFRVYDTLIAIDHTDQSYWVLSAGLSATHRRHDLELAKTRVAALSQLLASPAERVRQAPHLHWARSETDIRYLDAVSKTQDHIRVGDIYQANYSHAFVAQLPNETTPFDVYLAMRASNPAPFSAFGQFGDRTIACTSPERLFTASAEGMIEARPIKGTIERSNDPSIDQALQDALRTSEKDKAENTMIVDLLRNDLSQVCRPHSVLVPDLCKLESYAGLHQLTSVVHGELSTDLSAFDAFAALFPGGSITGAPKLRAMEIIGSLEQNARRAFCGSFGYFGFDGAADLNIMIRTVQIDRNQLTLNVGGGITALSDPSSELAETVLKAQKIIDGTTGREAGD